MNWKTVLLVLGAIVLGLGVLVKIAIRTPVPPAHQVFINGNVLTMDANNTVAEAVAVRSDLIEAVGSSDDIMALVTADTTVVDLRGRTLVPGFIDAHGHFPGSGMSAIAADLNSPPIGNINTMAEVLGALSEQAESTPEGDWVTGFGYDDPLLAEMRHPNKHDLDAISTDVPIYLYHYSAHQAVLNSHALDLLGIDEASEDPEGGHIARLPDSREPSGLLEETAMMSANLLAMRSLRKQNDPKELIEQAIDVYASQGFTAAPECAGRPDDIEILEEMAAEGRLKIDVAIFPFYAFHPPEDVKQKYSPDYENHFRVAGLKLLLSAGWTLISTMPP